MSPERTAYKSGIVVRRPSEDELREMGVFSWPTWDSPVRTFDWYYSDTETCYFLEGKVRVHVPSISSPEEVVEIGKGDLVTFPKGLSCTWEVLEPVRKHYTFG